VEEKEGEKKEEEAANSYETHRSWVSLTFEEKK
jgi:hypothetical protein